MNNQSKATIRQKMLAQRRTLSYDDINRASQQACAHLIKTIRWQNAKHIAFYIAHDSEIDPSPLMKLAQEQNKSCYLPTLASNDLKHLVFVHHQSGEDLPKNRYGIPEPRQDAEKMIAPDKLDLVITPLLAFDKTGTRLGMGAGYYDHTFAFLNQPASPKHTQLVGLAYHFQESPDLPHESWDIKLDWIVTDHEILDTHQSLEH